METVIILAVIVVLSLVLVLIFVRQSRRIKKDRELLRKQEEALMSQVSLLLEEQKKLEGSKKEIRDKISEWMGSGQEASRDTAGFGTVRELQDEFLMDMREEETVRYWADPVLNTIFLHKLEECRASGVDTAVDGFPEAGISIAGKSIAEMVSLFSNLIDNAFEACLLLPKGERWIRITAKQGKKTWVFAIENSCGESSHLKAGEKTWKKNKEEHGIGKEIIREIVDRNRGWVEFSQEEGVHRVELMLPGNT